MARSTAKASGKPTRAPRRQRGGAGWLVVGLLAASVLALVVFAPEQLRSALGLAARPASLGAPPVEHRSADGETVARAGADLEPRAIGTDADTTTVVKPPVVTEAPKVPEGPKDAVLGKDVLAGAEQAYRGFAWDEARVKARRLLELDVDAATRVRAEDILRGADALENIFAKLDMRDELFRSWDTHPSLVQVSLNGQDMQVVPVLDLAATEKEVPTTSDPAGWLRSKLNGAGEVNVVMTNGAGTTLKVDQVSGIRAADVPKIMKERAAEFAQRVTRVEKGAFANDALAWYEAAKYAYRNRLDERVTEMLDRALAINPFLANAIREDKANDIFLKMTQMLAKENKTAAGGWMGQLNKYYQDTTVYPQAKAYFEGNLEQLAAARKQAEEEKLASRQRTHEAKVERATKLQDTAALAKLKAAPAPTPEEDAPSAPLPATGDAGTADTAMNTGMDLLAKAQAMTDFDARDSMYKKAQDQFDVAMRLYEKLGMEQKMVQANQYRYACIKCRRAL